MKDSWLRAAISDTTIVADLLLRLKDSPPPPLPLPHTVVVNVKCLPPWGLRKPRFKQPLPLAPPPPLPPPPSTSSTTTTTTASNSKETTHPRRSPTTPLHWITCGGCDGGGCNSDGYDESLSSDFHVHPPPPDRLRSKIE